MFHGWRVESKREERGKYERNTEKETERKLKGKESLGRSLILQRLCSKAKGVSL